MTLHRQFVFVLACVPSLPALAQDYDVLEHAPPTSVYVETDYADNDAGSDCDWYALGSDLVGPAPDRARDYGNGCRVVIRLHGVINREGAALFSAVVRRLSASNHRPVRIELDSRGGDSDAAFMIAGTIRGHELFSDELVETVVVDHDTAVCFSACIIVFAAGYRRSVEFNINGDPRLSSRLGLHRPGQFDRERAAYDSDDENRDIMAVDRALRRYFPTVGVSAAIVDAMLSVPFDKIHLVTEAEANAWGLVTYGE